MRILIVGILCCCVGLAHAKPTKGSEAEALLERGAREYSLQRYDEAIEALEHGYRLEPDPDFLYVLGQSERMRGHYDKAIVHYQSYLRDAKPSALTTEAVNLLIATCEKKLADIAAAPTPAVVRATPGKHRPWQRDWLGATLVAVGGASLVAGAGLFGYGYTHADSARLAMSEAAFDRRLELGTSLQYGGIALLAIGGGALVGGVVRWIYCAKRGCGRVVEE